MNDEAEIVDGLWLAKLLACPEYGPMLLEDDTTPWYTLPFRRHAARLATNRLIAQRAAAAIHHRDFSEFLVEIWLEVCGPLNRIHVSCFRRSYHGVFLGYTGVGVGVTGVMTRSGGDRPLSLSNGVPSP